MTVGLLNGLYIAWTHFCMLVSTGYQHALLLLDKYRILFSDLLEGRPVSGYFIAECTMGLMALTLLAGLLIVLVLVPALRFLRLHAKLGIRLVRSHGVLSLFGLLAVCAACGAASWFLGPLLLPQINALIDACAPTVRRFLPVFSAVTLTANQAWFAAVICTLTVFWIGLSLPAALWKLLPFAALLGAISQGLLLLCLLLLLLALLLVVSAAYSFRPFPWVRFLFAWLGKRRAKPREDAPETAE